MKKNNWIAIALFTIILIAIGQLNTKIGLTIAGIIFLGTLIMNKDKVNYILKGEK